jgi:predicted RNA-binding protein YlxR (DUF448 family)
LIPLARQPVRTCVGCGRKAVQPDLVRLRAEAGSVVVDRSRSGGRGAWLHPAAECLDRAIRRRAFPRALRAEAVRTDAGTLGVELTGNARKN